MSQIQVVVTDANILINLIHVGYLSVLGALARFRFVVPDEVIAEIIQPEQVTALQAALEAGDISRESIENTGELTIFTTLASFLGKGESACLALAERRGWLVASDEGGAFRREAIQRVGPGRLINTPAILLLAIHARVLTIDEADEVKGILETKRFRVNFNSFRDLMNE